MGERLRLLLVEDDDDIALMIRKSLERAGHEVTRQRSAALALQTLAQQPLDLVLLDHYLPDMPGLQMLEAMQRERLTTPALIVTAYGDEQLATRVLHAGALDYIVKDPALAFLNDLPKRVHESVTRHRLQQFNRLLIEALESAGDGILITDRTGTILHVNHAMERMTGYARQELLGQNPRLLRSGVHPPEVYSGLWQAILSGASWQGELTDRRKDGSLFEISQSVSPIVDGQGQVTHFVAIQRDITEHKQLERHLAQAQKMQSIGTLASGVAHEFNNLLAGITGYASLAVEESPPVGPIRDFLQQVLNLSERAAVLTRQLLAFARKPPLMRRPMSMESLLRMTAEFVSRTQHIKVNVELEPSEPGAPAPVVEADTSQLQQALVNLALNSRDARTDDSAITFRLRRAVVSSEQTGFPDSVQPGDYVVLEVADQGSGMTPEVLNQSLDPFFTTKDVGRGTGLGLPVVFGIVHAHQGLLTIQSEPGKGTQVALYLPRWRDPAAASQA
jgi:PAS domain S-box-containing protein